MNRLGGMMRGLATFGGLALIAGGAVALPAAPAQKAAKPAAHKPAAKPAAKPVAKPAAAKPWRQVVVQTSEGFRMGNPQAKLRLVEYGSRGCPTCGNFANTGMEPLITNWVNSGKLSYEYREFWVHGAPDVAASLVGQCVGTAAFFPVLEAMYQEQGTFNGRLQALGQAEVDRIQALPPTETFVAWAKAAGYIDFIQKRGVPEAKARACLADQAKVKRLAQIGTRAINELGIQGTPTFFLNDKKLDRVYTWPLLEAELKAAGA